MELNLLMEFALLARHLNFSRTAQELNLTQPTLSRHIVQPEEELGVQLFRRDKQSVALTEAGSLFLPEAAAVLARYDAARRRLQEYRDGMAGSLILGYRWIYGGGPWPGLLQRFREAYPLISVRLVAFQQGEPLQDAVAEGVLDAAVTLCARDCPSSGFQSVTLCQVPLMATMGESHPLAGRAAVTPAELARERLLVPQARGSVGFPALMTELFHSCRVSPAITYTGERMEEALLRVQLDDQVALIPRCYLPDTPQPGLHAAQVSGTTGLFRLTALARGDSPNPAVTLFLRLCRTEVKRSRMEQLSSPE
ncbi:MAG TPA: LysR family transcriptional regulator [Candidatus Flavonifractor merdavium]|nr:LysR family transcriptional regulator [Candidatus Flavonifractor merdavium]